MPRTCTICAHAAREDIDRSLLAGESFRNISKRFGTSTTALFRHKSNDIPLTLIKAEEVREVSYAGMLTDHIQDLHARTLAILDQAEAAGDLKTALAAIREARANQELLIKLSLGLQASRPSGPQVESLEELITRAEKVLAEAEQEEQAVRRKYGR